MEARCEGGRGLVAWGWELRHRCGGAKEGRLLGDRENWDDGEAIIERCVAVVGLERGIGGGGAMRLSLSFAYFLREMWVTLLILGWKIRTTFGTDG